MSTVNGDSALQDLLKTLCQNNGWSYAVLWCSDNQNPTMLTMRSSYNEEQMNFLIGHMLLQVHILGTGMVGQAVSSMEHKWIFSNDDCGGEDWNNQNVLQDGKDIIHCEFSNGIKTIAFIPLNNQGLVQFGSTQKIYETTEFVNQAKELLWVIETSIAGYDPLENTVSSPMQCIGFQFKDSDLLNFTNPERFLEATFGSHDCPELFEFRQDHPLNSEFKDSDLLNCSNPERFLEATCVSHELPELFEFGPDHPLNYSSHHENSLALDKNDPFDNLFGCLSSSNVKNHINAPISNQEFSEPSSIADLFSSVSTRGFSNDIFDRLALGFPGQNTGLLSDIVMPRNSDNCLDFSANLDFLSSEGIDSILSNEEKEFFSFDISNCMPRYNNTMNTGSSGSLLKKSKEECLKNVNKMSKPESRSTPKDRVQVRERIAELRKLVPNGGKISIDSLLSQTVKHMLFLEGVTRYAETLRQAEEQRDNRVFPYDSQSTMELVHVKDLNAPGQILMIEMHLDETDFFADIVEIIHKFGLIIIKGNMETRGNKWWACFIVEAEANIHVTRQHIHISLCRFLNHKAPGNMNVSGHELHEDHCLRFVKDVAMMQQQQQMMYDMTWT